MARLSFLRRIQYTPTINMVCLMQADIYSDGRKKYAFLTLNNPTGKWHDNALAKITPYDEDDNALPAFGIRMDISTVPPSGFFAYPDQIELPLDAVAFDFEFIRIDGVKVARYVATGDHAPKPKEETYVAPAPTPAPAAVAPVANKAQPQDGQATVLPDSLRNEDGTKTVSGKVKTKYADSLILYTEYGALYVYADPSQLGLVNEGYTCSVTGVSKIVNGWERLENCSIFQVAEGKPDESLMAPGPINRGLPTAKEIKNAKNIEVISFRRKHISTAPIIVGSLFLAGAAVMMFGVTSFRAPFGPSGGDSSSGEVTEGNITYTVDRGANVASVKRINASGSSSVSIPQYTNQGVPVTTILGGAINKSSDVYNVDAPYVTNVETYAFVSPSLQRVNLGTDLGYKQALQIEGLAFDCSNLSELHLGGSVTLLDNNHFGKNLQIYGGTIASFSIPDSGSIYYSDCALTSSSKFFGSGNFNTLRIENLYLRNDTVPDYCFNNCHELYQINSISSASSWQYNVSRYAFSGSNIDFLDLSACYSIGYGAFKDCPNLNSVVVSSQLNSIGAYAFHNTPSLYNLEIPKYKSEINIDSTSFSPNTTVILKDGIYDGGQSSLSSQSFSWNTYYDGNYIHLAGYNGSATYPESIPSDVNVIDPYALSYWPYGNIELPYSVIRVEGYAFGNGLTTLNIQSDVTFAENAFSNSNNLNKIAGNGYYLNFEGVSGISSSVDIEARRIDFMDNSFADSSAYVNVSIDEFYGNLGFFGQKGISSVYINFHHGASNIDSYAFKGMDKLSRFQIDNSDYLLDIGAYAFNNCSGLSNFSFERVNSLDDYAFANTSIINASLVNASNIGFKVFEGGKLENVFLREGATIQEESFPVNATINYI